MLSPGGLDDTDMPRNIHFAFKTNCIYRHKHRDFMTFTIFHLLLENVGIGHILFGGG